MGEMIFETNNPSQAWDGNFHGKKAAPGLYVYKLRYKADKATLYGNHEGNVLLIR
ncbi:MAG: gliding motility-associated C-terminal domain-containing protein [Flavobacteriales bacterium]|nr:gliding motility-associated C-terminal domain-containing protein [Flavobacteriales bacterium]